MVVSHPDNGIGVVVNDDSDVLMPLAVVGLIDTDADGEYRLDHAATATQKTILKVFGIDTYYVKRKVREISD